MYERFYGLRERPFALSPDPDYLYPSRVHREALDYLRYGLESHAGFVAITGEIGSGKTTLLQTLLRGLDSQTTVGRIVNTMLDPRELIETIMIDFGLDPAGRSKPLLLRDLGQYLVDQRLAGRLVLLVIDEAQNLTLAALEELRMLSNLETEKSKLLQIVLVGQPNLRDKLAAPELEQLRQRITVSYHLMPLDAGETASYINHRLRRASTGAPLEFPRDVTDAVHVRSRGIPRIINVICDAALVFGYAEEQRQVDQVLIREVLSELEVTGVLPAAAPGTFAPAPSPAAASAPAAHASVSVGSAPIARPVSAAAAGDAFATLGSAPVTIAPPAIAPPAIAPPAIAPPVIAPPVIAATAAAATAAPAQESPARTPAPAAYAPVPARTEMPPLTALDSRAAHLDQRERALQSREHEVREQRRILAEEYRLLRAPRPPAAVPVSIPVRPGGGVAPVQPAERQASFWAWLKRILVGVTTPTVGEN